MRALCLALVVAFAIRSANVAQGQTPTYVFTTIAGLAGSRGSADGTNDSARFNYPSELAVDSAGIIYVSDLLNHSIRQVAPVGTNWVVTTLAGSNGVPGAADGTNSDALFNRPNGIAVNAAGHLFVADHYNHTVRKLTRAGTDWVVTTIAGLAGQHGDDDGTNSQARFWSPTGIAVDQANHLYVVDTANFTIRGIEPLGTNWLVSTLAGTPLNYGFIDDTNEFAEFDYPYGIAVNGAGTLYVTDWGNNAIRQITPVGRDWVTLTVAGWDGLVGTNDGPGSVAAFNGPNGITLDAQDHLYVTDQGNHTLRLLTPGKDDWSVSTLAGSPGQRGSTDATNNQALFNKPWGIALDKAGNLYVADYLNHTIRKGTLATVPVPTLKIDRAGDQLLLSWPATATNYRLETTGSLGSDSVWTSTTNGVVLVGGSYVVTNHVGALPAFYRLRRQ